MAQDTLAARIRAKYPGAYDDLDDVTLERQVRAKYPGVYDDLPSSEPVTAPTRPRTLWERVTGTTTEVPADIATQNQAMIARIRGEAPPDPRGSALVENVQNVARNAPAIGGTVGAIYGGPVGAAVGGALGETLNLALNPEERSPTLLGNVGQVGTQGAIMGATEAVVPRVLRGVGKGAEAVYRGYLKPSLAEHLLPRAKAIVKTALEEALPVTEAGVTRAKALITDLNQQVSQILARTRGQTIDLHAIAEHVRQFAQRKYYQPGRSMENYNAALRVADRIDQHPSLGLPPGVRPTRVDVSLPTAQTVKQGLYEEAGDTAFGVATGQATKEAQKKGGYYLKKEIEAKAEKAGIPQVGALNERESNLIDAAEAINRAVNREANQNALLGVKTLGSLALTGEEIGRTGDPYWAAVTGILARGALTPAVATRAAIVAYQLGKRNHLVPASAIRVALQAIQNTVEGSSEPASAEAPGR